MSIACRECGRVGSFNTLVIFQADGKFDLKKPVSHYANYYTDCANFDDFPQVEASRFMIVQQRESDDRLFTGTDGDLLEQTEHKLVSEKELQEALPTTFSKLAR